MIPKGVLDRQAAGGDEILDISERGRNAEGEEIHSNRRLFMQMLAFGDCLDPQPLVDALAELKMIRALQMRVNRRTRQYGELVQGQQAEQPEVVEALRRLAERETRIHRVTRDIVVGRNQ